MIYLKLYFLVLKIAFMSFGGAYSIWAMIDRELVIDCNVDNSRLPPDPVQKTTNLSGVEALMPLRICRHEFNSAFAVGEVLPGPQINAMAILAFRYLGLPGMLVIIAGLISPGIMLSPFLLSLQNRWKESSYLKAFLSGATIATMAILLVFFLNLLKGLLGETNLRSIICLLLLSSAFYGSYHLRINPLAIVALGAAAGYFLLR